MKIFKNMRKTNKRSPGYKTKAERKKERKELLNNSKMEKKILIGLYDDYRKGGKTNYFLNPINCKLVGTFSTEPNYIMYDSKYEDSAVVMKDGNHSIKVEVWEINEDVLLKIEKNYGFYPQFEEYPQDYIKETILSPFGELTIYFINHVGSDDKIVSSGDWIEHCHYKNVNSGSKKVVL